MCSSGDIVALWRAADGESGRRVVRRSEEHEEREADVGVRVYRVALALHVADARRWLLVRVRLGRWCRSSRWSRRRRRGRQSAHLRGVAEAGLQQTCEVA